MAEWKVIERFPDYEVSTLGNIRNRINHHNITPTLNGNYSQVELYHQHKKTTVTVHHIVAETFIPNPHDKPIVCHKDNNKLDNQVSNLEWKTAKENEAHKALNGITRKEHVTKLIWKCHTDTKYCRVCINEKLYRMHTLVAKAFLPNFYNKPHVNHKDGNRRNNRLYNLEWCTRSENMQHAYDTGLNKRKGKTLSN